MAAFALFFSNARASAADTLLWNTNQNQVTADIHSVPVSRLLASIAHHTGWQVFLEPNVNTPVSVKFQDLKTGEALRMLLGNLNFALVPQTNGPTHLYVFRTARASATKLIRPEDLISKKAKSGKIPNELVVTVKPGVKIDGLSCIQDAKVTGQIQGLNTYRVQFKDEAAAQTAQACLSGNQDVLAVESNYSMEPPDLPVGVGNASPQFNLNPKPNDDNNCQVIVGLVDTSVGDLGSAMDPFMMKPISVVDDSSANGSAPSSPEATTSDQQITHGTAMAETILQGLQANTGGNTSVKILPVNVYGSSDESTSTFDVTSGIYQAVNAGANVINLSLAGSGDSPVMHNLIQNAVKQGVVFFGAAGNTPVTTPEFPAAYPEVQAVTAGSGPGQIADYANRGSFVDLMLPGTSIVPFDGQSWAVSGTSTATAYATGIAAGLADSSHDCPTTVVPTLQKKFGVSLSGSQ